MKSYRETHRLIGTLNGRISRWIGRTFQDTVALEEITREFFSPWGLQSEIALIRNRRYALGISLLRSGDGSLFDRHLGTKTMKFFVGRRSYSHILGVDISEAIRFYDSILEGEDFPPGEHLFTTYPKDRFWWKVLQAWKHPRGEKYYSTWEASDRIFLSEFLQDRIHEASRWERSEDILKPLFKLYFLFLAISASESTEVETLIPPSLIQAIEKGLRDPAKDDVRGWSWHLLGLGVGFRLHLSRDFKPPKPWILPEDLGWYFLPKSEWYLKLTDSEIYYPMAEIHSKTWDSRF